MDDENEHIGANVRRLRERAGLTQAELADTLTRRGIQGIYPQTITKIEAGQRVVKFHEGLAMADVLGVSPRTLSGRYGDDETAGAVMALEGEMAQVLRHQDGTLNAITALSEARRRLGDARGRLESTLRYAEAVFANAGLALPESTRSNALTVLATSGHLLALDQTTLAEAPVSSSTRRAKRDSRKGSQDGEHPEAR